MKRERKIFTAEVQVKLITRVNGYALDVDDGPNDMTKEDMDKMIKTLSDGTAVIQIQREAAALQRKLRKQKLINKELEMKLKKYEW